MSNFKRALKLALTHRLNVVCCITTSLVIAILWGGNLTAVFPVVDIIMNDQSLPEWLDRKIAESQTEVADSTRWHDQLMQLKIDDPAEVRKQIAGEIERRQLELAEHKEKSAGTWNDVQIAEKTRLSNFIARLESIQKLPDAQIKAKVGREISDAEHNIRVHDKRAARYGWISPYAHRWLPTTPFRMLMVVCLFVLIVTIAKGIFRIGNSIAVSRLGNNVGYDLRVDFYRQVLHMDMANFTEAGRGDLMNRCTSDLGAVGEGVQRLFGQILLEPAKAIVCFGIAAWISWQLLLLTILIVPVAAYSIHWLGKALEPGHRRAMQELSSIYETLTETLGGIKLIKSFTMEPAEQARFQKSAREFYRRQMRIVAYESVISPFIEMLGLGVVLLASVMGGYLVLGQQTHILGIKISDIPLTHGDMSIFFAMLVGMADPARRLSSEYSRIQQSMAAADRVYEILDHAPTIVDPPQPVELPPLKCGMRFEGIDFHYHRDKPVLRSVDLEVRAGETLAIVGPNGCGKTTLLQLLPRFYDPIAGRITIEGVDIRNVRMAELRQRLGLVSQEVLMLNDTVANNIRYGNPNATQEEVEAAAQKAHAHAFIMEKLPHGYLTLVGPGGSRLSGGQRQRISLARAILRNPEVLLLDEATSQIDIKSEQLIFEVLKQFSRGRTTLMITHRVSMISLADRVVVMDHGRIVDTGTHDELVGRCDLYRRLCHFGYRESA